jgi:hypothetical protein
VPQDRKLKRANIEMAEELGLLNEEKRMAGAPTSWKLVTDDEVAAITACGLPFLKRVRHVAGPIAAGWTTPHIYDLIVKWEEAGCGEYADLTLTEWLSKTTTQVDSQDGLSTI